MTAGVGLVMLGRLYEADAARLLELAERGLEAERLIAALDAREGTPIPETPAVVAFLAYRLELARSARGGAA